MGLIELIDERVERKLLNDKSLKSTPCKVTSLLPNQAVEVELISTGATYTVPNLSGNSVFVGENVQLYYKTTYSNGYIGASSTQINTAKMIETAELNEYPQQIDISTTIADGAVTAQDTTWAFLHYSINLFGVEDCTVNITAYLDDVAIVFSEVFALSSGEYKSAERTVPVRLSVGEHIFRVDLETDHLRLRDSQGGVLLDENHTAIYSQNNSKLINIDDVSAQVWGQNIVGNTEGGTGVSYIQDILGELVETSSPETISSLLTELDEQRTTLAEILTSRGVEADAGESYNSLIAKVLQIEIGGNEPAQAFVICDSAGNSVIGNAEELEV